MKHAFGLLFGAVLGGVLGYGLGMPSGPWGAGAIGALVGLFVADRFRGDLGLDEDASLRAMVGGFGGLLNGALYGAATAAAGSAIFLVALGFAREDLFRQFIDKDLAETSALGGLIAGAVVGAALGATVGSPVGLVIGAVIGGLGPKRERRRREDDFRRRGREVEAESTGRFKAEDLSATRRTALKAMGGARPATKPSSATTPSAKGAPPKRPASKPPQPPKR